MWAVKRMGKNLAQKKKSNFPLFHYNQVLVLLTKTFFAVEIKKSYLCLFRLNPYREFQVYTTDL